jgi:hypothetical protein
VESLRRARFGEGVSSSSRTIKEGRESDEEERSELAEWEVVEEDDDEIEVEEDDEEDKSSNSSSSGSGWEKEGNLEAEEGALVVREANAEALEGAWAKTE